MVVGGTMGLVADGDGMVMMMVMVGQTMMMVVGTMGLVASLTAGEIHEQVSVHQHTHTHTYYT